MTKRKMESQEAKDIVDVICKRLCQKDGEAAYYLDISMKRVMETNIVIVPVVAQGLWKYKISHFDETSNWESHIDFQGLKIKHQDQLNTTTMHDMNSAVEFLVLSLKQVALALGSRHINIDIRKNIVCDIRKLEDMCVEDQAKDRHDPTKKGWGHVGIAVQDQVSTAALGCTASISKNMQVDNLRNCLKTNLEILMVMCKDHHNAWIMSK